MARWKVAGGPTIELLTPEELKALPPDARIMSICGETRTVDEEGKHPPDDDTRSGYTAWGLLPNARLDRSETAGRKDCHE